MAIINRSPRFILISGDGIGIGAQEIRASVRAMMGDMVKRIGDDIVGLVVSFEISFNPSAMG